MKKLLIILLLILLFAALCSCTEIQSDEVGTDIFMTNRSVTITAVYESGNYIIYQCDGGVAWRIVKKR